ncbi:hypothetical protein PCAR4_290072 [Paraburkholderia caribensis]|nr:hypothetical protein PCAR4_290072 [Paraburkholderia caribensis]
MPTAHVAGPPVRVRNEGRPRLALTVRSAVVAISRINAKHTERVAQNFNLDQHAHQ